MVYMMGYEKLKIRCRRSPWKERVGGLDWTGLPGKIIGFGVCFVYSPLAMRNKIRYMIGYAMLCHDQLYVNFDLILIKQYLRITLMSVLPGVYP